MRSQRLHTRWLVVAGVAAVVAAMMAPAAGAKPILEVDGEGPEATAPAGSVDPNAWADRVQDPYGALALQEQRTGGTEFVPGVTDSTTGVLRELERKGVEPRTVPPATSTDDSGFHYDDAAIGMGTVLAAAVLAAACAALVVGERRRRRPAI